jgi:hypothetical protein
MPLNKNIIIISAVATLIVVVGGYLFFLKPATSAVVSVSPSSPEEAAFIDLASQIDPLTFDTSIFSDPRFVALMDIHVAVFPEPAGRRDPFAPLGK